MSIWNAFTRLFYRHDERIEMTYQTLLTLGTSADTRVAGIMLRDRKEMYPNDPLILPSVSKDLNTLARQGRIRRVNDEYGYTYEVVQ